MKLKKEVERERVRWLGEYCLMKVDSKWNFYDAKMKQITNVGFDEIELYGDFVKVVKFDTTRKVGLYDENAKELIPIEWKEINVFREYIECVSESNKTAILTYNLKVVLPLGAWKSIHVSKNGIIASMRKGKVCLYNWKGKLILSKKKSITFLNDYLIRGETSNGKFALYSRMGKELLPADYSLIDMMKDINGNQYIKLQYSDLQHGLYTTKLSPIIPCGNNYIYYNDLIMTGILKVKIKGKGTTSYLIKRGKIKALA